MFFAFEAELVETEGSHFIVASHFNYFEWVLWKFSAESLTWKTYHINHNHLSEQTERKILSVKKVFNDSFVKKTMKVKK